LKDLTGEEVDENKYFLNVDLPSKRPTIKSEFRRMHGFKNGLHCKNCNHFLEGHYRGKVFFKCQKMGLSHSVATDIRKSDIACSLYDEREGERW